MPNLETLCFLVSRLTPTQRSLLARLPVWGGAVFVSVPMMECGHLRGLYALGLVARHPLIPALFQRTALGDAVLDVLIDTEVAADG